MRDLWRALWLVCAWLSTPVSASDLPAVGADALAKGTYIGRQVLHTFDDTLIMGIDDVVHNDTLEWQSASSDKLSFGFRKSAVWLHFSVAAPVISGRWWLAVEYPLLNEIDVYQVRDGIVRQHLRGGTRAGKSDFALLATRALFPVSLEAGTPTDFYVRVHSDSSLVIPLRFLTATGLLDDLVSEAGGLGLMFGALLVLILYHLTMLILFRDGSYILFIGFNTGIVIAMSLLTGVANRYVFATADESGLRVIPVSIAVALWLGMLMTREFLSTARLWPRLDVWMRALAASALAPAAITLASGYHVGIIAIAMMIPPLVGFTCFASARAVKAGFGPARYFLSGWAAMVAGTLLYALRALGVVPDNGLTAHALHGAVVLLMGLIALALTARFRLLMDEEASARRLAMEEIRLSNQRLETEVEQRTVELNEEIRQLMTTQKALAVQERRFASGVMSAGVAHEINNPNNFVNAGAQLYQAKLEAFRRLLNDLLEGDEADELRRQFAARLDVLEACVDSVAGVSRQINEIVGRLRTVASTDESATLTTDIVERLRATIEMIGSGLQDRLSIDVDFVDSPEIFCNAGELIQAFVSILNTYAEYTTPGERQAVMLGSCIDTGRLKLYVRPALPCIDIRDRLAWLEPVLAKQAGWIEWEVDGGMILLLPLRVK